MLLNGCSSFYLNLPSHYQQQLCMDTGLSLEDLSEIMDIRDKWQERGKSVQVAQQDDVYTHTHTHTHTHKCIHP